MSMTEETKTKLESSAGGDLSDVENGNCSSSGSGGDTKKTCVDCGTSRTPLWRGGPAGPKSLCNACGIKSRKKRQAALGVKQEDDNNKIKNKSSDDNSNKMMITTETEDCNVKKIKTVVVENPHRNVKIEKAESGNVKKNNNKKMVMMMIKKTETDNCNDGNKKTDRENGNKKNVKRVSRFLDFKVPAMKRSAVEKKRIWRKLGEEERAAVLLMTLSCG